jgi:hypothetical protein
MVDKNELRIPIVELKNYARNLEVHYKAIISQIELNQQGYMPQQMLEQISVQPVLDIS